MIIELWRKPVGPGLPICFTKGEEPKFVNAEGNLVPIAESPPVKAINFYETGAFKLHWGACFVIQFDDSPVRRVVFVEDVKEIAYAMPEKDKSITPALED